MDDPHFGHTSDGRPVHKDTLDYHPNGTRWNKFNKSVALWLTTHVGSMNCFWIFCGLALLSLPATFVLMGVFSVAGLPAVVKFFLTFGWIYLITWICQNFIQLICLPAIIVGQQLQNEAADARNAKQFEDTELIADRLDLSTEGGLQVIEERLKRLERMLEGSEHDRDKRN